MKKTPPSSETHKWISTPLKVAAIYLLVAGVWIMVSDHLLDYAVRDEIMRSRVSTYKAWIYIAVTTLMLYALIRQDMLEIRSSQMALRALTRLDELTGAYNRRGFMILAEHHLRASERTQRGTLLFFIDLNDMKGINDNHGHSAGDDALSDTAEILRQTFRSADIIGRMGGDEFAVMATSAPPAIAGAIADRLQQKVCDHNAKELRPFELALSFGIAEYDPTAPCTIDELLAEADEKMYSHKRQEHSAPPPPRPRRHSRRPGRQPQRPSAPAPTVPAAATDAGRQPEDQPYGS